MSYHGLNMNFICDSCIPKLNAARAADCPPPGSADKSSEDDSPNVTCVQVQPIVDVPKIDNPISTSTPVPSPDNSSTNFNLPVKPLALSYAAAVATPAISKEAIPKLKPQARKARVRLAPSPSCDIATRVQQLEEMITKCLPPVTAPSKPSSSQTPARDRCLIIIKAPESLKTSPAERILDDQNFLQKMVTVLFDENEDGINVVSAFRLGRKSDDPVSNPRPLKVVLKDNEEARRVFSRTSRLKGLEYRVFRDLCPEDRIRMRQAVQELKQRRQLGESNLHIVDFQVVVRRPRVVWHPVAILPRACLPN